MASVAIVLVLAVPGCVDYHTSQTGNPQARAGLACLSDAPLGLDGTPAHSPQAARCIRTFLGARGRTIGPNAGIALSSRGFGCAPAMQGLGQECVLSFASDTTLHNPLGSGGSLQRQEVRVTVGYDRDTITEMGFSRTSTTSFDGSTQANRLVEQSANLVGD